jgi:hypothetical protein
MCSVPDINSDTNVEQLCTCRFYICNYFDGGTFCAVPVKDSNLLSFVFFGVN